MKPRPILFVLPYALSDTDQALDVLLWIKQLGGCRRNPCLLVSANNVQPAARIKMRALAEECFSAVHETSPPHPLLDEKWPRGGNWLFATACTWIGKNLPLPFWWGEADCIPLHPGWLEELETEYYAVKKPFLGTIVKGTEIGGKKIGPMVNGVAIYPADTSRRFQSFNAKGGESWDVWMTPLVIHDTHDSKLVQHFWGEMGLAPTFRLFHEKGEPRNVFTTEQLQPGAAVFHRCKDLTLTRILRQMAGIAEPLPPKENSFYHTGDLGDIIYAMPTVAALGGGTLYLGPDNRSGMPTRETMTKGRFDAIAPLLKIQPYLNDVQFREKAEGVTHDLNDFRKLLVTGSLLDCQPGMNLARVVLHFYNLPLNIDQAPWLIVDAPKKLAPVVIARSFRYHNRAFPWKRVLMEYRDRMVFVGLEEEHRIFQREFGTVPYAKTTNLLEMARIIAGAELFIGNQSCPYSVAIGLGVATILENDPAVPNCLFDRKNVMHGIGLNQAMPKLAASQKLLITAPVENFTGYGQMVHAICTGLVRRGVELHVNAFCFDESKVPVAKEIVARLTKVSTGAKSLLICSVLEVPDRVHDGDLLFTMWEATGLSQPIVDGMNRCACVIVPTEWNAQVFKSCGVTVPIRVVPLGIDPSVFFYRPQRTLPNGIFSFGTAGRLAHAGARKGIEETMDWFVEAFPTERDVRLHVKIFQDCPLKQKLDPRILVERRFMGTPELVSWYSNLNCFISVTKGEGWGLHLHQAMAIGRPVIVARQGGQTGFVRESNSYCCRYTMQPADWGPYKGMGDWCVVDKAHCIELMRRAYRNRLETERLGREASANVAKLTWHNTVNELVKVLKEFSKL